MRSEETLRKMIAKQEQNVEEYKRKVPQVIHPINMERDLHLITDFASADGILRGLKLALGE